MRPTDANGTTKSDVWSGSTLFTQTCLSDHCDSNNHQHVAFVNFEIIFKVYALMIFVGYEVLRLN